MEAWTKMTRPDHNTGIFIPREVRGFFNVPGNHYREDAGVRD